MKLLSAFFSLLFIAGFTSGLSSQGIPIGQWRDHLPYNTSLAVANVGEKVYCATPYSMFFFNKSDNSITRLNKINGLSDFGISTIKHNTEKDILFIAYSNANVDLMKGNTIINMPEIKRANILGKKTINNVYFLNDYAYISCGFGIVVMDLEKEEIKDTYYIGPEGSQIEILDLTSNDTSFFAATESGIYYAEKESQNLANYANWKLMNLPYNNTEVNHIAFFDNKLIANINFPENYIDTLFTYNGSEWEKFDKDNAINSTYNLNICGEYFAVSELYKVLIYDQDLNLLYKISNLPSHSNPDDYIAIRPNSVCIDDDDFVWIADRSSGMLKISEWNVAAQSIKPEGPPNIDVFALKSAANDIWVAPGGKNDVWGASYNTSGVFHFHDETWNQYYAYSDPLLAGLHDFITLAANPFDPENIFAGCFRNDTGLVEFNNGVAVQLFDDENSTIQKWPAANKIAVTGLDFDTEGNLWLANSGAPQLLSVKKQNGEWKSFNLGSQFSQIDIGILMVDSYNQKWILKRKTIENPNYIIVYNDNSTIDDENDDEVKGLTASPGSGNIYGNKLFCITEDKDGEIWIGSDNGVSVIYNPQNIFTGGNYDAQRIIIPRNDGSGLGDILLENEFVKCITVDGDNNKWIGTDGAGVFCISADGMTELYHFTTDNSPLFSNLISDIAINDDGEVFIGTSKGIISFRAEQAPPKNKFTDVYAYPNPVREGYNGTIGIKGLISDANIKITDISGNLIFETRSLGGQAVWDGKSLDGRKAETGVYLVFITNDDGTETIVTKILFIK